MASFRSSSLPVGGNPFWSESATLRLQVAAARPQDLPDDELEERQPLGRGRARSRSQLEVADGSDGGSVRAEAQTGASRSSFATALRTPTSWITSKKEQSVPGERTEGMLPPDEEQPDQQEVLEKELGKVMYEQLADENELLRREIAELKKIEEKRKESEKLRAELEGLKRKMNGPEARSTTSWSDVGVEEHHGQPPPKTPRAQKPEACGDDRRFTPGGTQVPPGLPPDDVIPGPPLPPWPPWMSPVEEYQSIEESFRHGKIGDATPRWMRERVGEPTPEQARMMWLEREVQTLGKVLRNQAHGSWDDRYWAKRAHQWPSLDGQDASQAAFC